jgi:lysophospholipid acyltransferase (LPLAT)-like uncharacterized protein
MKIQNPLAYKFGGLLGLVSVRAWMSTLDYKVAYYDPAVDPILGGSRGQRIYVFWHEYIPFPLHLRGRCNLSILLSRHRDAELLTYTANLMGFDVVRGSSRRGGMAAIRQLLEKSRSMHLALTPDGPRGPRRRLAPGAVFLASRLGLPLVAMGFGYDRPWRFRKAWDQFAVPRPFTRARAVISAEIHVPSDLDRQGIEHFRERTERLLNRLTLEAEAWAESGTRKLGQRNIERRPVPLPCPGDLQ